MTVIKNPANQTNLQTGVIWNLASLGFLALAGLMLNFAIARFYGSEALGIFNMAFALYIFASQFGAFGIHFSLLQSISKFYGHDDDKVSSSASSALIALVIATTIITLVCWLLLPFINLVYGDKAEGLATACLVILPGLWAFSINKGLYNIINAARHMRIFAVLQALRYFLMLLCFVGLTVLKIEAVYLTAVFSITEIILMPVLFFFASRVVHKWKLSNLKIWVSRHTWFGARVFLSGAILELNTRVDILMIGYFLNAESAGIYSVAALVAEGAGQAVFAIRNNFNPLITRMIVEKKYNELLRLSRKSVMYFTPFMAIISVIAYFVYPLFCRIMFDDMIYLQAHIPLAILLGGITASCGLMTFNMIFSQASRPATHTFYVMMILLINFALNFVLIPKFGIIGAALSTALAYFASVILLIVMGRWHLKVRLLI